MANDALSPERIAALADNAQRHLDWANANPDVSADRERAAAETALALLAEREKLIAVAQAAERRAVVRGCMIALYHMFEWSHDKQVLAAVADELGIDRAVASDADCANPELDLFDVIDAWKAGG